MALKSEWRLIEIGSINTWIEWELYQNNNDHNIMKRCYFKIQFHYILLWKKKKKKTHKQINICIVEFGLQSGGVKTKSVAIQEMPCVLNEMKKTYGQQSK